MKSFLQKAGLLLIALLLSAFIAELALRVVYPGATQYYIWQPLLQHTFRPNPEILTGIHGEKHFTINRSGLRGPVFKAGNSNYICIGGSTTECLYLDDSETWYARLQNRLNAAGSNNYALAGIGKSGTTTREHYIQLKYFVPQVKEVTGVVVMAGINDLMKRLSRDTLFENNFVFTPAIEDSFVNTIFLRRGRNTESGWLRRTALFHVLRNVYRSGNNAVAWQVQDDNGQAIDTWRSYRYRAPLMLDTLPDLTTALQEYERNLQLIFNEAKRQKLQLVFINQAALYTDTMPAYKTALLWMGGKGNFQQQAGHLYYTPRALRQGLDSYNRVLETFCAKNSINFIDISSVLPRDTTVFYDDCHFNENGARLFAEKIPLEKLKGR